MNLNYFMLHSIVKNFTEASRSQDTRFPHKDEPLILEFFCMQTDIFILFMINENLRTVQSDSLFFTWHNSEICMGIITGHTWSTHQAIQFESDFLVDGHQLPRYQH